MNEGSLQDNRSGARISRPACATIQAKDPRSEALMLSDGLRIVRCRSHQAFPPIHLILVSQIILESQVQVSAAIFHEPVGICAPTASPIKTGKILLRASSDT